MPNSVQNTHIPSYRAWNKARGLPMPRQPFEWHPLRPSAQPARLPFFSYSVPAGFPSPADDHLQEVISLDEELIEHPAATFLARVVGNSMRDANIAEGDVLVVDRALTPEHGDIVIASLNGELTVKRLSAKAGVVKLLADNPDYPPIKVREDQELTIWGVVIWTIRRCRRASR